MRALKALEVNSDSSEIDCRVVAPGIRVPIIPRPLNRRFGAFLIPTASAAIVCAMIPFL